MSTTTANLLYLVTIVAFILAFAGASAFPGGGFHLPEDLTLPEAVEELERLMIAEALRRHSGNVSRASRDLGITRRGLQLKLARYQMRATA